MRKGLSCPGVTCRPATPGGGRDGPAWEGHMAETAHGDSAPLLSPLLSPDAGAASMPLPKDEPGQLGARGSPQRNPQPGVGGGEDPARALRPRPGALAGQGDGGLACTPPAGTRDGPERKETRTHSGQEGPSALPSFTAPDVPSPWAEGGAAAGSHQNSPARAVLPLATEHVLKRCCVSVPTTRKKGPGVWTLVPAAFVHVIFLHCSFAACRLRAFCGAQ